MQTFSWLIAKSGILLEKKRLGGRQPATCVVISQHRHLCRFVWFIALRHISGCLLLVQKIYTFIFIQFAMLPFRKVMLVCFLPPSIWEYFFPTHGFVMCDVCSFGWLPFILLPVWQARKRPVIVFICIYCTASKVEHHFIHFMTISTSSL